METEDGGISVHVDPPDDPAPVIVNELPDPPVDTPAPVVVEAPAAPDNHEAFEEHRAHHDQYEAHLESRINELMQPHVDRLRDFDDRLTSVEGRAHDHSEEPEPEVPSAEEVAGDTIVKPEEVTTTVETTTSTVTGKKKHWLARAGF